MLFFSLTRPSPCCQFETEIFDRDTTLVKILTSYDNPKVHWVHEQRYGQREQLCAPRTLLRYNRSLDPFRNYIVCTNLCFWSDKISISQLITKITISSIVVGLKNSHFSLIHSPSFYRTACYRAVCYWTVQQTNHIQSCSLNQPITTLVSITIETVYKLLNLCTLCQFFNANFPVVT